MTTRFEETIPVDDLMEIVSLLRGGSPDKWLLLKRVASALGCLAEKFDGVPLPQPMFGSPPDVAASMMDDARMANEIERLVTESNVHAVASASDGPDAAPKAIPAWLVSMLPILMQLLQQWLSRKVKA